MENSGSSQRSRCMIVEEEEERSTYLENLQQNYQKKLAEINRDGNKSDEELTLLFSRQFQYTNLEFINHHRSTWARCQIDDPNFIIIKQTFFRICDFLSDSIQHLFVVVQGKKKLISVILSTRKFNEVSQQSQAAKPRNGFSDWWFEEGDSCSSSSSKEVKHIGKLRMLSLEKQQKYVKMFEDIYSSERRNSYKSMAEFGEELMKLRIKVYKETELEYINESKELCAQFQFQFQPLGLDDQTASALKQAFFSICDAYVDNFHLQYKDINGLWEYLCMRRKWNEDWQNYRSKWTWMASFHHKHGKALSSSCTVCSRRPGIPLVPSGFRKYYIPKWL